MSAKSAAGPSDAWDDDDWESQADVRSFFSPHFYFLRRLGARLTSAQKLVAEPTPLPASEKKVSSKVTKAQRRAQQAEFNRQLWAEAYVYGSEGDWIATYQWLISMRWLESSRRRSTI